MTDEPSTATERGRPGPAPFLVPKVPPPRHVSRSRRQPAASGGDSDCGAKAQGPPRAARHPAPASAVAGGRGGGGGGGGGQGGQPAAGRRPARAARARRSNGGQGGGQRRRRRRWPAPSRRRSRRCSPTTTPPTLDATTLKKRSGRQRKGKAVGRYQMNVHVDDANQTHIAVLEGRSLIEHYVSRPADDISQIHGNIYIGRVENVLPGMEAAFIDIGTPKNAVLYRGDVHYDPEDVEKRGPPAPHRGRPARHKQLILCQVTKNPIGHKGARLTQEVSLPGRFVVLVPNSARTASRSACPTASGSGCADPRQGEAQAARRDRAHRGRERHRRGDRARRRRACSSSGSRSSALAQKQNGPGAALPRARHGRAGHPRGVQHRVPGGHDRPARAVRGRARLRRPPSRRPSATGSASTTANEEPLPLFERFQITEQLKKGLDRKVWLPSGGSLIIEHTEALTVIDVNTGRNVGSSRLEETVFRNNLEAAIEIARQLRLRDIGGIIVIDFVDMEIKANRDELVRVFKDALSPGQDPHPGLQRVRARPGRDDPQAHRRGAAGVVRRPVRRSATAGASS